jgi:molybdenum cofactor cytidylyltransferase
MKFGSVPIEKAEGGMLAHAVVANGRRFPKAHRIDTGDIDAFRDSGIGEVIVAMLEPGDLDENTAASALAAAIDLSNIDIRPAATGRVNLHAKTAGVFTVRADLVNAVNAVDPAVTLATLAANAAVEAGQMVATLKIIPFAVSGALIEKAAGILSSQRPFEVHSFQALAVGLVQTTLSGVKASVLDKTARITSTRLARSGSHLVRERRTAHAAPAVAEAISGLLAETDMAIVFGASAMCDFDDVIPAAIRLAGGTVIRAGMPVDPGNLLVLGTVGGKIVIGAPGCARSPRENGFDWVLDRLMAGVPVGGDEIARMGVGGLLMEISTRPQPREDRAADAAGNVHAVVLAAGRSSRMGGPNKLMARFDGEPLVVRVADRVLASKARSVTLVTGHQAERLQDALQDRAVAIVRNESYASGLASSLKAGIAALPSGSSGCLVVLGDMPHVESADLDRLITAFEAAGGAQIVRAVHAGKRGNPVILPRSLFAQVALLDGDVGARQIVESAGIGVIDVEIGAAASVDVDTADAMAQAGGILAD